MVQQMDGRAVTEQDIVGAESLDQLFYFIGKPDVVLIRNCNEVTTAQRNCFFEILIVA
ncbi:hypothetical protein D3C87_1921760 [compost metagenome]